MTSLNTSSNILNPYELALQLLPSPSFVPPSITIQPWISDNSGNFGGDIKIIENKIDMSQIQKEEDLPEFLRNRYVSIFVDEYDGTSDGQWNDLHLMVVKEGNMTEFRTQKKLFVQIWEQVEAVLDRLSKLQKEPLEIRSTFYCTQSNLESIILKQILCQELSDVLDVLIVTDVQFCCVRFFKRAMEPNLKKFSKRVRGTFELTELASRVHSIGLQYNPAPFPVFNRHEIIPRGFKAVEEEVE